MRPVHTEILWPCLESRSLQGCPVLQKKKKVWIERPFWLSIWDHQAIAFYSVTFLHSCPILIRPTHKNGLHSLSISHRAAFLPMPGILRGYQTSKQSSPSFCKGFFHEAIPPTLKNVVKYVFYTFHGLELPFSVAMLLMVRLMERIGDGEITDAVWLLKSAQYSKIYEAHV